MRCPRHEQLTAAGIRGDLVDGTITSPLTMTAADVELLGRTHRLVLLGERLAQVAVDHVAVDSVKAAATATRHLLGLGRRRIAVIGTGENISNTGQLRLRGHRDAMTAAGLSCDASLEGDVRWYHRPNGHAAMQDLLRRRPDLDAVFCFNDLLAIGALRALREAGRRVPDDVAVVGFDDVEDCRFTAPPITSISPDKQAIATTAVDLLVQRMHGTAPDEPQEVFAPFTLAVRQSSVG